MVFASESIKGMNIRVFKWKQQQMLDRVYIDYYQFEFSSPEYGFLVLRIKKNNTIVVQPFLLVDEESPFPYQVDLVKSIGNALELSNLFCLETTTIHPLANTISAYLKSCFGKTTFCTSFPPNEIKIVVVVDLDVDVGVRFGVESSQSNMYEILWNGGESSGEKVFDFYAYGVLKSDNKRRGKPSCAGGYVRMRDKDLARLDVEFVVENSDIQDIVDSICNYMIEEARFLCYESPFDGKKQEFRELLGGLKIMTVSKVLLKNIVHNFELGDDTICPICFEKFYEESMVAVITPCSHIFHRSCIFSWLSEKNSCPMCREKVVWHE